MRVRSQPFFQSSLNYCCEHGRVTRPIVVVFAEAVSDGCYEVTDGWMWVKVRVDDPLKELVQKVPPLPCGLLSESCD